MFKVRKNVFETNSSSTHSLSICTEDQYKKWEKGEILYDDYNKVFSEEPIITEQEFNEAKNIYNKTKGKYYKDWEDLTEEEKIDYTKYCIKNKLTKEKYSDFVTKTDWYHAHNELEHFTEYFTTPSGDKMVAFGYYGYDG